MCIFDDSEMFTRIRKQIILLMSINVNCIYIFRISCYKTFYVKIILIVFFNRLKQLLFVKIVFLIFTYNNNLESQFKSTNVTINNKERFKHIMYFILCLYSNKRFYKLVSFLPSPSILKTLLLKISYYKLWFLLFIQLIIHRKSICIFIYIYAIFIKNNYTYLLI